MVKLSACVIVKNEEKHLPRWLACVRQLADELIVVDTGSEDKTVEIAEAGGARVFSFPWRDDFSAAKNFALEQAAGKWILFLDADEYFPPESISRVRSLLEETDRDIRTAGILCRWVNFDEDNGMQLQSAAVQLRLFRNLRGLRYKGRIHEALDVPKRYKVLATKEIEIHHTGYSQNIAADKLLRNRRLLLRDIEEAGGKASLQQKKYLLDCAYGLKEWEETCHLAEEILRAKDSDEEFSTDNLAGLYSAYISSLMRLDRPLSEIEKVTEAAERALPMSAEFPWMLGLYLHEKKEPGVQELLRRGLSIYESCRSLEVTKDFAALGANAAYLLPLVDEVLKEYGGDMGGDVFISACVIVKNEAENLPKWLASVRAFADEMIVVDTGSEDNSKELAKEAGARVFDFQWINDFAAAKNFALEKAHGRWIVFPDADEYFDEASQQRMPALLRELEGRHVLGVTCPLINIDKDDNNRVMEAIVQLRIFRNLPQLRYQGYIHEVLSGIPQQGIYLARELTVYHTGYSSRQQEKKFRRNLAMLEEGRQQRGDEPGEWHYFMDTCYGLRDYEQAIVYAKKIIAEPGLPRHDRKNAWETWASSCLKGGHPLRETIEALEGGLQEFPNFYRLKAMMGLCFFEGCLYEAAEKFLRESLSGEDELVARQDDEAVTDSSRRLLPHIHARLGEIAYMKGRDEEALVEYMSALQENRLLPDVLNGFQSLLQKQGIGAAEQIELISGLYSGREDELFLGRNLLPRAGQVWLYYRKKAGLPAAEAEGFLIGGHVHAAALEAATAVKACRGVRQWGEA